MSTKRILRKTHLKSKRPPLTIEVREVELVGHLLPEAAGAVGRQQGAQAREAAGPRHSHVSRVPVTAATHVTSFVSAPHDFHVSLKVPLLFTPCQRIA